MHFDISNRSLGEEDFDHDEVRDIDGNWITFLSARSKTGRKFSLQIRSKIGDLFICAAIPPRVRTALDGDQARMRGSKRQGERIRREFKIIPYTG